MRRAVTISQILADLPRGAYWQSNECGTPTRLTLAGKAVVAALEDAGFEVPKIIAALGLKLSVEQFEHLRKQSCIADADVHRRSIERKAALASAGGVWKPQQVKGRF